MPTCEQVANARLLAQTLEKVAAEFPEHFHMMFYTTGKMDTIIEHGAAPAEASDVAIDHHHSGEHPRVCGTSGCALGWAPYATGIPIMAEEDWLDYANRVFGIHYTSRDYGRLFLDFTQPYQGAEGAARAAERIWEWIEENEADCVETT